MQIALESVITGSWILFLLVWLITGFGAKRIARTEGRAGVAGRILIGVIGCLLLSLGQNPRMGILAVRFLPLRLWIAWLGAAMTFAGVLFAIWARVHLGRYWSSSVALKNQHKLIRTGPYARIRHPIYTGVIFAIAGTAVTVGTFSALLAVAVFVVGFWVKARKEESLLAGEFGPAFNDHLRATGFFLPRLTNRI